MEEAFFSLNSKLQKLNMKDTKLEKLSKEESECRIYRVHRHLRNVNSDAYEPEVIAIGPYHHDKDHLKMMENHKLHNIYSLVKRLDFNYAAAVSSVESSKARKCYADQDFKLTDSQFIEMLVLDGCFIIELVRKFYYGCLGENGDDPIFGMEWMITSLQRDLMLFENQIPFFVLLNLFHHVKGPNETRTLLQLLTNFFSKLYPGNGPSGELLQVGDHKIKHLLDLIHHNWVHPRLQQLKSKKKDEECQKCNCFRWMCCKTDVESRNEENSLFINHATELTEANVECQKPNPIRTMCGMPVKERKYKEVVISSLPVQERNESEIVLGSMPVQERKENEDMTGSMPLQERKENEVVLGSMPLQDMKGNEVVTGSMSVQEMKEKEIVTIDSMPVPETNETEFRVDMLVDETPPLVGSSMPVLERKNKIKKFKMDDDTHQFVLCTSGTPVLETKNKIKKFKMDDDTHQFVLLTSGTPVLERKETDQVEGSSMPPQDKKGNADIIRYINHATELTEANVEFKKKEKQETVFDVHFEDGAMVMPPLLIQDGTECFLRNLIMYEQYFGDQLTYTVVTDYMKLLDNLIDSAKDVEILSRKDIITNWQGDAEVVAKMMNKLGDLVICGGSNFSYATMFEEVNEHCRKPWNRWMAKLRRDYLNSPWAIISIIAAVVLLLLTVTQTVLSILQVVQEN